MATVPEATLNGARFFWEIQHKSPVAGPLRTKVAEGSKASMGIPITRGRIPGQRMPWTATGSQMPFQLYLWEVSPTGDPGMTWGPATRITKANLLSVE